MDQRLRDSYPVFPFVQVLAAVLILSVLTAVAVPAYVGRRRSAAAQACKASIATLAKAEAAYALRHGVYTAQPMNTATALAPGLMGAPEGLSAPAACPLDRRPYSLSVDAAGALTITCPNAALHAAVAPPGTGYSRTLGGAVAETVP